MAEWSIAAVLKTVELRGSGGSNPSLSAEVKGVSQDRLTPFIIVHLSWTVSIRSNRCWLITLVALQVKWQAWLGKPYVSVGAGVGNTRGCN